MDKDVVAHNLLRLRSRQGLTQEQLAERAGITARTVQRIEAGSAAPHLSTLSLLADALARPVQELTQAPERGPTEPAATPHALVLLHLLPLLGLLFPFANLLAPLGYWLLKREADPRLDQQGPAVVNFQLTVALLLGLAVGLLVFFFPAGLVLLGLGYGLLLGLSCWNAQRVWRGLPPRYPGALPLLKAPAPAAVG